MTQYLRLAASVLRSPPHPASALLTTDSRASRKRHSNLGVKDVDSTEQDRPSKNQKKTILERARSANSKEVFIRELLRDRTGFEELPQPPYSPDL
uniref:Uncharacterized protein n=1 Tax=Caenorhabditis japonica TaxID=281687 RepID=A0A8R1IV11_CAEJA